MRSITRSILAATSVVGLLAIPVAASATSHTSTTTVTFTVANTGGLSVATASGTASLGTVDTSNAAVATGALPQMTVTDNTNPLLGSWNVTVNATSFNAGVGKDIAGGKVSYWSGAALPVGASVVVPVGQQLAELNAQTLDVNRVAVAATGATGNNSATFTPSLSIDLTGAATGTYSGTIVHSVTAG